MRMADESQDHPPAGPACEEPERPPANDAYEAALAALRDDKQTWWADTLACDPRRTWRTRRASHRRCRGPAPLPRRHGAGQAERLGRYEVHRRVRLRDLHRPLRFSSR